MPRKGKGEESPKENTDSKDAKRKSPREVGQDDSLPAGKGDPEAPHPKPGSGKYGESLDKKKGEYDDG